MMLFPALISLCGVSCSDGALRCFNCTCSKVDVVEAAYALLQRKLGAVRDFVSLQRAHTEFLATLRAKFYIDSLEISQVRCCAVPERAVLSRRRN